MVKKIKERENKGFLGEIVEKTTDNMDFLLNKERRKEIYDEVMEGIKFNNNEGEG